MNKTENTATDPKISRLTLLRFNRITAIIISSQKAATLLMLLACILGLTLAQTPLLEPINEVLHTKAKFVLGGFNLSISLEHFVSEGLLSLFFFLIGLEIAREFTFGYLKEKLNLLFFLICAFFSIAVPIMIFLFFTRSSKGMYIPMATDIALALAVLRVMKRKIGRASNVFLLTLSVMDDIFGIIVIAFILTSNVNLFYLSIAAVCVAILIFTRKLKAHPISLGVIMFGILWVCLYKAGVHATIAGAIIGLLTPIRSSQHIEDSEYEIDDDTDDDAVEDDEKASQMNQQNVAVQEAHSSGEKVENVKQTILEVRKSVSLGDWLELHILPWVNLLVLPLFVFVNSLIVIDVGLLGKVFTTAMPLGIIFGLAIGKVLGITFGNFLSIKIFQKIGKTPEIMFSFYEIAMIGMSAGIGFSVSVLLSSLIFEGENLAVAKLAVLFASAISAILALLIYKVAPPKQKAKAKHQPSKSVNSTN